MVPSPAQFVVIANCEDELALWPATMPVPATWRVRSEICASSVARKLLQHMEQERRPHVVRRMVESGLMWP